MPKPVSQEELNFTCSISVNRLLDIWDRKIFKMDDYIEGFLCQLPFLTLYPEIPEELDSGVCAMLFGPPSVKKNQVSFSVKLVSGTAIVIYHFFQKLEHGNQLETVIILEGFDQNKRWDVIKSGQRRTILFLIK